MHIYDTLIIGSGYFSVGYAVSRGNCIICEENQICDTHFYMPLKSFAFSGYEPKTAEGEKLNAVFSSLSLFGRKMQNVNGFECGFCRYLTENPQNILLKCRVLSITERMDGINEALIQTNEGITHIYARNVLSTLGRAKEKYFTVLFTSEDNEGEASILTAAFPGSYAEPAFYDGRYALHIPADGFDENGIKLHVYRKWRGLSTKARIIYMAPVLSQVCEEGCLCDDLYSNPIEAFEAGYFCAEEVL